MDLKVSIQKNFGSFSLNADFNVEGERIGLFGPSGSGKSTLVGLVAGLYRPDTGVISLDGTEIFDSEKRVDVPVEHRRIGMVFQRPHLFPHLSVRGNLLYGYKRCEQQDRKIKLDSLVEVLQIGHLLHRGVRNLSGGEKQRVAIGRTVLSNPRLLVMDEPLSALDDNLKFQIIPFLKGVCETFSIPYLFISHSLTEMRIMTDKVLRVVEGHITSQMTLEQLARIYMGESKTGYVNLLNLRLHGCLENLYVYSWGDRQLFISGGNDQPEVFFELPSTDIILFKRHPEAISARNLLQCNVTDIFETGHRIGVELECTGQRLVAEVVRQAVEELKIKKGNKVYAAIKASAFKRLG